MVFTNLSACGLQLGLRAGIFTHSTPAATPSWAPARRSSPRCSAIPIAPRPSATIAQSATTALVEARGLRLGGGEGGR